VGKRNPLADAIFKTSALPLSRSLANVGLGAPEFPGRIGQATAPPSGEASPHHWRRALLPGASGGSGGEAGGLAGGGSAAGAQPRARAQKRAPFSSRAQLQPAAAAVVLESDPDGDSGPLPVRVPLPEPKTPLSSRAIVVAISSSSSGGDGDAGPAPVQPTPVRQTPQRPTPQAKAGPLPAAAAAPAAAGTSAERSVVRVESICGMPVTPRWVAAGRTRAARSSALCSAEQLPPLPSLVGPHHLSQVGHNRRPLVVHIAGTAPLSTTPAARPTTPARPGVAPRITRGGRGGA
jgi:hypothetical protein